MKARSSGMTLLLLVLAGCDMSPTDGDPASPYDPHLLTEGQRGTAIVSIPNLPPQRVEYVVRGGLPMYADDLVVSPAQLSALADPRTTAAGRRLEAAHWPNCTVPFEFDASVPLLLQNTVTTAMNQWSAVAPVVFTAHTAGSGGDYLLIILDTTAPNPASDAVGRIANAGVHRVYFNSQFSSVASALHELGHIIGLYHEQQRFDRDSYMIVWDGTNGHTNRIPASSADNYKKYTQLSPGRLGNDGVDYVPGLDFSSIMMYPSGACTGGPCMTRLDGVTTWNASSVLSDQDADGVRRLCLGPFAVGNLPTELTNVRDVAVTSPGTDRVDALAIRASDNHVIHMTHTDDNGWLSPADDFGALSNNNGKISAASTSVGVYDWASISGSTIFHSHRTGTITTSKPFSVVSPLGVALSGSGNRLDMFAVMASPPRLWHKSKTGSADWTGCLPQTTCFLGWTLVADLGSGITGQVVGTTVLGRTDVVVRTTSGLRRYYTTQSAGSPIWLTDSVPATGLKAGAAFALASWGPNRYDFFYYRTNNDATRISFEGGWGPPNLLETSPDTTILSAVGHVAGAERRLEYVTRFSADILQLTGLRR